eukprot:m51a1_g11218 hypothetical protein (566) ;mRNA; r:27963-30306
MSAWVQTRVRVALRGSGACKLCTSDVLAQIPGLPSDGVLHLFCLTPLVSLCLDENADPTVRRDLEEAVKRMARGDAAVSAALCGSSSLTVPIRGSRLALGTWQGVYVCSWSPRSATPAAELVATARPTPSPPTSLRLRARGHSDNAVASADVAGGAAEGLAHVLVRHTSASVCVAPEGSRVDAALDGAVPEAWNDDLFEHTYEGPDDMPAHVKCAMVGACVTCPVSPAGALLLPDGHRVAMLEHRSAHGSRELVVAREPRAAVSVYARHAVVADLAGGSGSWADVTQLVAGCVRDAAKSARAGIVNVSAESRGCAVRVASEGEEGATAVAASAVPGALPQGLAHVLVRHTSASVCVAPEGSRVDAALDGAVPEAWNDDLFEHTYEGPDDMPAHVKCAMVGACVTCPVSPAGALLLPDGHRVAMLEHRSAHGSRELVVAREPRAAASVYARHAVVADLAGSSGSWADVTQLVAGCVRDAAKSARAGIVNVSAESRGCAVRVASEGEEGATAVAASAVPGALPQVIGTGATLPVSDGQIALSASQRVIAASTEGSQVRLVVTLMGGA